MEVIGMDNLTGGQNRVFTQGEQKKHTHITTSGLSRAIMLC